MELSCKKCIADDIVPSEVYKYPDDSNFEIVNFSFLDRDIPYPYSYCCFVRICYPDSGSNNRILCILNHDVGNHNIRKAFTKFNLRHPELIVKIM